MTHREIFNGIYDWLETLDRSAFQTCVRHALRLYEPATFFLSRRNRAEKIQAFLNNYKLDAQQLFALIFSEGSIGENSFNGILFQRLLIDLKLNQKLQINLERDSYLNNGVSTVQLLAKFQLLAKKSIPINNKTVKQLLDLIWDDLLTGQTFSSCTLIALSQVCKNDIVIRLKASPLGTSLSFLKCLRTNPGHPLTLILNDGKLILSNKEESSEFKLLMAHARSLLNIRMAFFCEGIKKEENSSFNRLPPEIKLDLLSFLQPALELDRKDEYCLPNFLECN